ncbi:Cytosolic sulfotransferase 15, partial [Mucuna pruriens]
MASTGGQQENEEDKLILSLPKETGTTWLKALTFAIVNHQHFSSIDNHPLLTSSHHDLVPPLYQFRDPLPTLTLKKAFEMYCNEIIEFGPW